VVLDADTVDRILRLDGDGLLVVAAALRFILPLHPAG
jgi:hypothetical protein